MDFTNLGTGNPFYVLRKDNRLTVDVGVVKSKSQPRLKYPIQMPNGLSGVQQVIDVVATINGKDETFNDVPMNIQIAARGTDTFSCDRDAMLQAVDALEQESKKAIDMMPYHESVLSSVDKMREVLNPQYAANKEQSRTILSLQEKQKETERQLLELQKQNSEMLGILRQLNGTPSPQVVVESK